MIFQVDPNRSLPLFSQIMEGVQLAVATGRLKPGDRIPSIRDLSVDLRVNPNTVAKAYQELERSGLIEVRRGAGYFIATGSNGELSARERERILESQVEELLGRALELGFDPEAIKDEIDRKVRQRTDHKRPGDKP